MNPIAEMYLRRAAAREAAGLGAVQRVNTPHTPSAPSAKAQQLAQYAAGRTWQATSSSLHEPSTTETLLFNDNVSGSDIPAAWTAIGSDPVLSEAQFAVMVSRWPDGTMYARGYLSGTLTQNIATAIQKYPNGGFTVLSHPTGTTGGGSGFTPPRPIGPRLAGSPEGVGRVAPVNTPSTPSKDAQAVAQIASSCGPWAFTAQPITEPVLRPPGVNEYVISAADVPQQWLLSRGGQSVMTPPPNTRVVVTVYRTQNFLIAVGGTQGATLFQVHCQTGAGPIHAGTPGIHAGRPLAGAPEGVGDLHAVHQVPVIKSEVPHRGQVVTSAVPRREPGPRFNGEIPRNIAVALWAQLGGVQGGPFPAMQSGVTYYVLGNFLIRIPTYAAGDTARWAHLTDPYYPGRGEAVQAWTVDIAQQGA